MDDRYAHQAFASAIYFVGKYPKMVSLRREYQAHWVAFSYDYWVIKHCAQNIRKDESELREKLLEDADEYLRVRQPEKIDRWYANLDHTKLTTRESEVLAVIVGLAKMDGRNVLASYRRIASLCINAKEPSPSVVKSVCLRLEKYGLISIKPGKPHAPNSSAKAIATIITLHFN